MTCALALKTNDTMINILKLRDGVINQYRRYVESFLDIKDRRLKEEAKKLLDGDRLWPAPLLQCNPGFEKGEAMETMVREHQMAPALQDIFANFRLHRHQAEAIKLGIAGQSFIVTSGTGSGKSLTYLGTVFNGVLSLPQNDRQGVKAIIVYPMNALINSQEQEIDKYAEAYQKRTGEEDFPITYHKYTGQESQEKKEDIIANPPHILLTNYMMLELLLTRSKESALRKAILANLDYLVFDELHTYRGRKGADVAMLIRRIKAKTRRTIVCIGTSATLSSGTLEEQQADVAYLGQQLFDEEFSPEQIVGESLKATSTSPLPGLATLTRSIETTGQEMLNAEALIEHPLAIWLERTVVLEEQDDRLMRGKPVTLQEIAERLGEETGMARERCEHALEHLLLNIQQVNEQTGLDFLPFRVHQFVGQKGTLRVTLEAPSEREIETEEEQFVWKGSDKLPLFPVAFNRFSGYPYIRVWKDKGSFEPWDPRHDEVESELRGYLLLDSEDDDEALWSDEKARDLLPDHWFESHRGGRLSPKRAAKLPQVVYFLPSGRFQSNPFEGAQKGYFLPDPILIDPYSGVQYDAHTQEYNKVADLGDAGRSISTTILTHNTLLELKAHGADDKICKFMSFTDNRQDAALQCGHFNDFMRQVGLRAAIYHTVNNEERDYASIVSDVFDILDFPQEAYAINPGEKGNQLRSNEEALKDWLRHLIFYDLRRGWRHRLPNLEQCALIEIKYLRLSEYCEQDEHWAASILLSGYDAKQRLAFLTQFLDHFRRSFALHHHSLERKALDQSADRIRNQIKEAWLNDLGQRWPEPVWMRTSTQKSKRFATESIGPRSVLGRYVRHSAQQAGHTLANEQAQMDEIEAILSCLVEQDGLGFLHPHKQDGMVLYRLNLSVLKWTKGDGEVILVDKVRHRSAIDLELKPNSYFQALYQRDPKDFLSFVAAEHTGQILQSKRQETEAKFRTAEIKALYCSPTMELGIDIDELAVVHMRNVPPNAANYVQRSGRAGRKGQGALIFTFCSDRSPHDKHYFEARSEMVSGTVMAQKLDLANEELLKSHLQAEYLASANLDELRSSLDRLLDLSQRALPLLPSAQQQLSLASGEKERIYQLFAGILSGLELKLNGKHWYDESWLLSTLNQVPQSFDECLDRWREIYQDGTQAKEEATRELNKSQVYRQSDEWKGARQALNVAQERLDLIRNKGAGHHFSEFYPYRYLASEGFLPGYNFTRLPIRLHLQGTATYLSKPRMTALVEFGPENRIYQAGAKRRVTSMKLPPTKDLGLALQCGAISREKPAFITIHDHSGDDLPADGHEVERVEALVPLQEMASWSTERITCQEEERMRRGYHIATFVHTTVNQAGSRKACLSSNDEDLLELHYLPSAEVVRINSGWKAAKSKGFYLHSGTGRWLSDANYKKSSKEEQDLIKKVSLYTSAIVDCLLIKISSSASSEEHNLTLMYALKKAIESIYQIESQELMVELIGIAGKGGRTILFYESAEGSLGILSQLAGNPEEVQRMIREAYHICRFGPSDDEGLEDDEAGATYQDLLDYYNQRYHRQIDRRLIKPTLRSLLAARVEMNRDRAKEKESYQEQYQNLLRALPENHHKARAWLRALFLTEAKLPDLWEPDSTLKRASCAIYEGACRAVLIHEEALPAGQPIFTAFPELESNLKAKAFKVIHWSSTGSPEVFIQEQAQWLRS